MTWNTWLLFAATETALCFTPGPAVLLVLSQGLTRGTAASVCATAGILGGNAIYFALSTTSLSALILASHTLFSAVKWAGAAYLVWLGVTAFVGRSSTLSVTPAAAPAASPARTFASGLALQLGNPKALVFFTALLPQFIDAERSIPTQVAILAVTSVVVEFFVLLGYGIAAGRLTPLARRPRFQRVLNGASGTMLVAAGVSVARVDR